jgi:hypothetical protein
MMKKKVILKTTTIKEVDEESSQNIKDIKNSSNIAKNFDHSKDFKNMRDNLKSTSDVELNSKMGNPNNSIQSRFKTYCRIRPYDGVNKSFFKSTDKDTGRQVLSGNKSVIDQKLVKEFGGEFNFDYIFDEEFTQLEIFQESCIPLIENLVDHKKSSVLMTQGLNDSGKTFTIIGDTENPGILPLTLRLVYDKVREHRDEKNIKILCNFFEIYDEEAYDLLSTEKMPIFIPNDSLRNQIRHVTFFSLDNIQDFSNALNLGNKRKKMNNKSSLSNTIFKIILRFTDEKGKKYEECSLSIIDTAFPSDKDFININTLKIDEPKTTQQGLYEIHKSLCKILKMVNKDMLNPGKKVVMWYSQLSTFLRYYLYGDEKIVLLTNLKPKIEHNEENMKVLYFAKRFQEAVETIDLNAEKVVGKKFTVFEIKPDTDKKNKPSEEKNEKTALATSDNKNFKDLQEIKEIKEKVPASLVSSNIFNNKNKNKSSTFGQKFSSTSNLNSTLSKINEFSSENITINALEKKPYFSKTLQIQEIKKEYEDLQKKCAEQENMIKELIEKKNQVKDEKRKLEEQREIHQEVNKSVKKIDSFGVNLIQNNNSNFNSNTEILSNQINKDLKDLLRSLTLPRDLELESSSLVGNSKLFNVFMINPTIQNLTITNRVEDSENEKLKIREREVREAEEKGKAIESGQLYQESSTIRRRNRKKKLNNSEIHHNNLEEENSNSRALKISPVDESDSEDEVKSTVSNVSNKNESKDFNSSKVPNKNLSNLKRKPFSYSEDNKPEKIRGRLRTKKI